MQVDRKNHDIRNEAGVIARFGVPPKLIPDYLALVGDAADGFPGIKGIGPKTAARLLNRHGPIDAFPDDVLGDQRGQALLFRTLATLRTDAPLFASVDDIRWRGPTPELSAWAERVGDARLAERAHRVATEGPKSRPRSGWTVGKLAREPS